MRNEPSTISEAVAGVGGDDSDAVLRNEPTVISEAVAVGDGNAADEVAGNERGEVRSVRFDTGLTGAMRDAGQLLRPEIRLADSVRLGNRGRAVGGGSRRERRLRKKEEARAGAG